jgi:predicted methyltransferase
LRQTPGAPIPVRGIDGTIQRRNTSDTEKKRMLKVLSKTTRMGMIVAIIAGTAAPGVAAADVGAMIDEAVNGWHRSEVNKLRDAFRHPKQTLLFFGLEAEMKVIEITPGGGWYSEILAPVLRDRGAMYAASYEITEQSRDFFRRMDANYRAKLEDWPSIYDRVEMVYFNPAAPEFAPANSVDMVLTFRNVHNWAKAGTAEAMFQGFANALKPGGILGLVEHRAKPGTPIRKQIESGYMTESYVIEMALPAGFRLARSSEIHATENDPTDHPGGVWTLLPHLRDVPAAESLLSVDADMLRSGDAGFLRTQALADSFRCGFSSGA